MHEPLFVIYALLQRNHGFRTADALNIVNLKNNVFGVGGILGPYFTKDIELTRCDMGHSYVRDFSQPFQHEFCLMRLFQENAHIGNKGIPQFNIIKG